MGHEEDAAGKGYWGSVLTQRLGRRRLIKSASIAGGGLVAAAAIGCGGGDDGGAQSGAAGIKFAERKDTTKSAKPGGTYQDFATRDVSGFDYIAATGNIDRGEAQFAYSRLFKWKPGIVDPPDRGEIEGDLAQSWEINLNALQITVKLRPEAKWDSRAPTNSRPLDAQDVKYSFDRMKAVSLYRQDWFSELNPAAPFAGIEAPDARTVVLKLNYPLAAAFDYLANTLGFFCMPRESESAFDPRKDIRGTGPWLLDKYQTSVGFEYKRNPNWYIKGLPFLDGWSRPIVSEQAQLLAQFRAGNIWGGVVRQEDVIQTKKDLPRLIMFQGEYGPTAPGIFFGWLNQQFKDVRVRRAMSMLIDRELFAEARSNADKFTAEGISVDIVYDNFLGRGWGDYWLDPFGKEMGEAGKYFKYDPTEAKKLLSAAGLSSGFDATFYGPTGAPYGTTYVPNAEALAGMLREANIKTKIEEAGYSNDYVPNYNYNQAFDGWSVFVNTTYGGVANNLRTNFHSASVQDRSPYAPTKIGKPAAGPKDTTLDGLIDSLLREIDYKKAVSLAHDVQRHLANVMYVIPFSYKAKGLSLNWPWVGNAGVHRGWVITSPPTDTMPYLWYDASKRTT